MADIDIQEKKRPFWPWLLGIVAVVALVWVLYEAFEDEEAYDETADEAVITEPQEDEGVAYGDQMTGATMAFAAPVAEYVNYVETNQTSMGENHDHTAQGLRELSEALSALVNDYGNNDQNVMQERDKLNTVANEIQKDPSSLKHANKVKDAFTSAASIMDRIQENNFPNLNNEVQQVSDAANKLKADEELLSQKDHVNNFFKESKEALEQMASNANNIDNDNNKEINNNTY